MKKFYCPICDNELLPTGPQYSIEQLFELWKPTFFSPATIDEHRNQSPYTRMFSCPVCELDIFLPQIIGTPSFYKELQIDKKQDYYEEIKWDFLESIQDISQCNSIIEFGCGTGNFLKMVENKVHLTWGVEYNLDAIRCARNRGLNVTHISEGHMLPQTPFDLAISFHVLEHINNPKEFVMMMSSRIKPGGKICISVPNQDGPLKYIHPCIMNMPPHHATRWHKKTFEVLADRLHLHIDRIAFEPLSIANHYYYSYYWARTVIPGESCLSRFARFITCKISSGFFELLKWFHVRKLSVLKGQSIYIVMSKPDE